MTRMTRPLSPARARAYRATLFRDSLSLALLCAGLIGTVCALIIGYESALASQHGAYAGAGLLVSGAGALLFIAR